MPTAKNSSETKYQRAFIILIVFNS